jgi:predicted metal-dependent enzyme (double-stranded beta helix superfamily)
MSLDFQGKNIMIEKVSKAVSGDCPKAITDCLRDCLCELMQDDRISLPACVFEHQTDHYSRRLVHQDNDLGYSILAMTWGPRQSTPVHDHAGMWCVEAVWHGQIEVAQYELMERQDDRYRLERRTIMRTGVGSAGSLIPPHEYHTITNPDQERPAVTIHIYAGEMDQCCVFSPIESDWYQRHSRELSLDAN